MITRPIQPGDNATLAIIIRNVLKEFGANKPRTVYYDHTTDQEKPAYIVVAEDDQILGGTGIFFTNGLPADTCKLVKMYLSAAARGKGIVRQLMEHCFVKAKENGFKKLYIETMPELATAVKLYDKFGFTCLKQAFGKQRLYWM